MCITSRIDGTPPVFRDLIVYQLNARRNHRVVPSIRFFANLYEEIHNKNKSYHEKGCLSVDANNYDNDFIDTCFWPEG
jgi:hypothetical protein